MVLGGHIDWREFPAYVVGPCAGATISAGVYRLVKGRVALNRVDRGKTVPAK